jgi:hypothetical protein
MLIVHVHVHVRPESVADFRQATIENARSSVQEPGIARFDVVEQSRTVEPFARVKTCGAFGALPCTHADKRERTVSVMNTSRPSCRVTESGIWKPNG